MRSTLKKPRIHEVILLLENLFKEFRILHDFVAVKALSPKPEILVSITEKLSKLREEARDYLVENGLAVPKTNNFEIISAAYQHEVEVFLKNVAPYFPRAAKAEDIGETEPRTPPGFSGYPTSISEFPAPHKNRTLKFKEADATRIIPIASITSQGRLAALLSDEPEGNHSGKVNMDHNKEAEDSTDPFSGKHTPRGPKENVPENSKSSQAPPGPPSNSSNSDTNSEPRKLPKIPDRQ